MHKVTLNLDEDDWEFLKQNFPKTGASTQVRKILSAYCERVRALIKAKPVDLEAVEIEL